MSDARTDILTLTLNPAVDRTVRISRFAAGQVNRVEGESVRAGGKGINVATSLAEYGVKTGVLGFLGQDNDALFTEHFARHGLRDLCWRLPGQTRTGIKITDPVSGETTDINFPGLTPTVENLANLDEQLTSLPMNWCVLSGSLPPGVSPDFYRDCIALLKRRGVRTVLDTSGLALEQALLAGPAIIKPNIHELESLLGMALPDEADVIEAARGLLRNGLELVVVSRGEKGACFVTRNETVTAMPPKTTVTSTVGAGDAMVAGIVAGLSQNTPLVDCARLATAFSMHALTRESGAELSGRRRIDAFQADVLIKT